jgi:hypothetical protein
MQFMLRKLFTSSFLVIALSLLTHSAQADTVLPGLTNLDFLSYTGSAPKNSFTNVDPVGWTGGSGLIFIDSPGTSTSSPATACGPTYLSTWGCPSTLAIHGGYNFVEADGNPDFESGFNYLVSGLTPGTTYTLSFYQAASQQGPLSGAFTGNTTEQWVVSLGTSGLTTCIDCGPYNATFGSDESTYSNPDPNASVVATPLMSTPSGGLTDWNYVSVNLKADSSTDLLSFLAWGDDGTTANLPPIVFLAGVNSPAGLAPPIPEPATVLPCAAILLIVGVALWRRRKATA